MPFVTSQPFPLPPEDERKKKKRKRSLPGAATLARSLEDSRQTGARLKAWWAEWRRTSGFVVLAAFVVIYLLLAVVRKPGAAAIAQAEQTEELVFWQGFLKSYCAAGGTVFTERRRGGNELYPRGVVLQGELLDAFRRAAPGTLFTVRLVAPPAIPLAGFDHFPPVYVGGEYFSLERKINFGRYRYAFLVRKDTEQAGAVLIARVEPLFAARREPAASKTP